MYMRIMQRKPKQIKPCETHYLVGTFVRSAHKMYPVVVNDHESF